MAFLGIAAVIAIVAIVLIASGGGDGNGGGTSDAAQQGTPTLTAGQTKKLTYTQGDQVKFRVKVDHADEVHIHGYDIEKEIKANQPETFSFKATINGEFEVELHHPEQQIAQLIVNPK